MVMNILIIKIPWRVSNHETGLSGWKCSFFYPISNVYVSRSALTYRALYYGKIETQSSYMYMYIYIFILAFITVDVMSYKILST